MELCEKRAFFFVAVDSGLLFVSAVLTGANAALFADVWLNKMDPQQRRKRLSVIAGITLCLISTERLIRSLYPSLLYYRLRNLAEGLFFTANSLMVLSICSLTVLQTQRLDVAFRGSVYQLSSKERRLVWGLVAALLTCLFGYTIVIGSSNPSPIIVAIRATFAIITGILSMTHILIIDRGFGTRLRALVTASVSHSGFRNRSNPVPSTTNTNTLGSPNTSNENGMNTTMQSLSKNPQTKNDESESNWYKEFQNATLRDFDPAHTPLLRTAAKNSVLTLWLNLATLLIVFGAVLFSFRDCLDEYVIFGDILALISTFLSSLQTTLSFGHSHRLYNYLCWSFDRLLIKLTMYVVKQEVLQTHSF